MNERINSLNFWNNRHTLYERNQIVMDDWLSQFRPVICNCNGKILDIGCGSGNDTLYFIQQGKRVTACDQSENAIENIRRNFPEVEEARCFDFLDGFDFPDREFEIICADLCLHYFRKDDTLRILGELKRILKDEGHLFVRVNSMGDTLHGAGEGEEVEPHLYRTQEGMLKRFFDENDVRDFFADYKIEFLEEQEMNRYTLKKVVYTIALSKLN